MAIRLQDVNGSKSLDQSDSILDVILKRKEAKSRLRQSGEVKKQLQRPWENETSTLSKRHATKKRVMKPYLKNSQECSEEKLLQKIKDKAFRLFNSMDLNNL